MLIQPNISLCFRTKGTLCELNTRVKKKAKKINSYMVSFINFLQETRNRSITPWDILWHHHDASSNSYDLIISSFWKKKDTEEQINITSEYQIKAIITSIRQLECVASISYHQSQLSPEIWRIAPCKPCLCSSPARTPAINKKTENLAKLSVFY